MATDLVGFIVPLQVFAAHCSQDGFCVEVDAEKLFNQFWDEDLLPPLPLPDTTTLEIEFSLEDNETFVWLVSLRDLKEALESDDLPPELYREHSNVVSTQGAYKQCDDVQISVRTST